MKKVLFIILVFNSLTILAQRTYWKKEFGNGTLYMAVIKSSSEFGPHIRTYFSNRKHKALLYRYKKFYNPNIYRLKKRNGWSGKAYFKYDGSKLIYIKFGKRHVLTRISRSETPRHVREKVYFREAFIGNQ